MMPVKDFMSKGRTGLFRSTGFRRLVVDGAGSTAFAATLLFFAYRAIPTRLSAFCLVGACFLQLVFAYHVYRTVKTEWRRNGFAATGLRNEPDEFSRSLHVATATSLIVALACGVAMSGYLA